MYRRRSLMELEVNKPIVSKLNADSTFAFKYSFNAYVIIVNEVM